MSVEVIPIRGIGEVGVGDDLAGLIFDALERNRVTLVDGDVVVVTHKVVSKAEGAVVPAADDETRQAIIEEQATRVLRRRGELVIAETHHGFVCANAGVDRSNMQTGWLALLPRDPDRSARRLQTRLGRATGAQIAVIITDTFGRAWRRGLADVAIGVAGMQSIIDYRGTPDTYGRELQVTEVAIADEIAAAADLAMGKTRGIPAAVVRGVEWRRGPGRATDLIRQPDEDLFR